MIPDTDCLAKYGNVSEVRGSVLCTFAFAWGLPTLFYSFLLGSTHSSLYSIPKDVLLLAEQCDLIHNYH